MGALTVERARRAAEALLARAPAEFEVFE